MRRFLTTAGASLACLTLLTSSLHAQAAAAPPASSTAVMRPVDVPVYQRVGNADCIVVAKVTDIAEKPVTAAAATAVNQKVEYKIATIKISDALTGVKGLTEIKVGFQLPARQVQPGGPGGGPIRPPIRRPPFALPSLAVGQEALLFLNKHPEEEFYVFAGYATQGPVNKQNNAKFDQDVKEVKRCLKLLTKPMTGLKSKDASERLFTAYLLLDHYRPTTKPGLTFPPKTKAIGAEESKLILQVIAEADWTKMDPKLKAYPNTLFSRLGLTAADGWTVGRIPPGQNYLQFLSEAFKAWVKDKGKDYRIQRYVIKADKTDKAEGNGK
jgi:hypothetical protein